MSLMDDWTAMADKVRNWGRWGADDELGTLNLITEDRVRAAAAEVTKGAVFPLGMQFGENGPQGGLHFRRNPLHVMTVDGGDAHALVEQRGWVANATAQELAGMLDGDILRFNDDMIVMHLQAATQWDALSHVYYDEKMYNGFPSSAVTSLGASKLGIEKVDVKGITSRGVLLDVARHRGVSMVPHGEPISPEELTAVAEAQGTEIHPGDIVAVHTGWTGAFLQDRTTPISAGLHWRCAAWLHERDVAAVAADTIQVEDPVSDIPGNMLPMHLLCLREMGLQFGEYWSLSGLAADCAEDGRYSFQLIAPPLSITGAVGSPVNPIALK
jgi:kynurenine formamidase